VRGQSGNPGGRPAGARNHKTLAAAILLDGEAETLTRKAVELALAGDPTAMKAVAAALADGIITPGEGEAFARIVDTFVRAIETSDFECRLKAIERADAAAERDDRYRYVP
jgi:Family of unknown function (DUF5681)